MSATAAAPDPQSLARLLAREPALPVLRQHLEALGLRPAYLVGGFLRDLLLGRPPGRDIDLVVEAPLAAAAAALARRLKGRPVPLDPSTIRIPCALEGLRRQIDLSRLNGPDIASDLARRDFTINALAIELTDEPVLLDPVGGRPDLDRGVIRMVSARGLDADPLRLLRAVRVAAQLGFRLERETEQAIAVRSAAVVRAAGERARDEVFKILAAPRAADPVERLDALGLLPALMPEIVPMKAIPASPPHRLPLWPHAIETLRQLEEILVHLEHLLPGCGRDLRAHLEREVEGGIRRGEILKWVALLHDVGKPRTRAVGPDGRTRFLGHEEVGAEMVGGMATRFRLGRRATAIAVAIVRHHMRPILLAQETGAGLRARFRFFRDVGAVAADVLLHSLADARATVGGDAPGAASHLAFVREMFRFRSERLAPGRVPLLRGEEVMATLGVPPGPLVGYLLGKIGEAEAVGEIRTREEATDLLRARSRAWRDEFAAEGHQQATDRSR